MVASDALAVRIQEVDEHLVVLGDRRERPPIEGDIKLFAGPVTGAAKS